MSAPTTTTTTPTHVLAPSEPSVCIPRTFSNITWKQVKETFETLFGQDCIARVDMVRRETTNGERFQRVFVHFRAWPKDTRSQKVRQRLLDGREIKIIYDEPWFWKCSMSRVAKPDHRGARDGQTRSAPYIQGEQACATSDTPATLPHPVLRRQNAQRPLPEVAPTIHIPHPSPVDARIQAGLDARRAEMEDAEDRAATDTKAHRRSPR